MKSKENIQITTVPPSRLAIITPYSLLANNVDQAPTESCNGLPVHEEMTIIVGLLNVIRLKVIQAPAIRPSADENHVFLRRWSRSLYYCTYVQYIADGGLS